MTSIFEAIKKGIDIANVISEMTDRGIMLEKTKWNLNGFKPDNKLLDIGGCGEYIIMNNTECDMIIIDNDPDKYINNKRVKTYNMDAQSMKFEEESFQHISLFYTLLYMDNNEIKQTLLECNRVLKKAGHIYCWDIMNENVTESLVLAPIRIIGGNSDEECCFASNAVREVRNVEFYKQLITSSGLKIFQMELNNNGIYLDCIHG